MNYKIQIKISGLWYDFSDYIIEIDECPYIERNRSFEMQATGMDLSLNTNFRSGTLPDPNVGDIIHVENITTGMPIWAGLISKIIKYDWQKKWRLEISSRLTVLKNYLIDYPTLRKELVQGAVDWNTGKGFTINYNLDTIATTSHGLSTGDVISFNGSAAGIEDNLQYFVEVVDTNIFKIYTDKLRQDLVDIIPGDVSTLKWAKPDLNKYCIQDNYDLSNVQLSYLLDRIFNIAGMNIILWPVNSITFDGKIFTDYVMDESALYCLNQSFAFDCRLINPPNIDNGMKITFFDFLKTICGIFGFYVRYNTTDYYELRPKSDGLQGSFNDDFKYNYSYEESNSAADYNVQVNFSTRANYGNSTANTLNLKLEKGSGGTKNSHQLYNNLFFLYRGTNPGETSSTYWDMAASTIAGLKNYEDALIGAYYRETITTGDSFIARAFLSARINIIEKTVKIIQEWPK